jgi:hypothetical protein
MWPVGRATVQPERYYLLLVPMLPAHSQQRRLPMLIARQEFQAKYGRGDELVALFQELNQRMREEGESGPSFRILTDASGPFFTVVTEAEVESLAAWEGSFREAMSRPWMNDWFARMMPLVESGSREFYHVVE